MPAIYPWYRPGSCQIILARLVPWFRPFLCCHRLKVYVFSLGPVKTARAVTVVFPHPDCKQGPVCFLPWLCCSPTLLGDQPSLSPAIVQPKNQREPVSGHSTAPSGLPPFDLSWHRPMPSLRTLAVTALHSGAVTGGLFYLFGALASDLKTAGDFDQVRARARL